MVGASTVVVALVVLAQAPEAADAVQEAKTYFQAGQQAYEAGYYLDAARAFQRAYDLVPNPAITFSLAQTFRRQFYLDRDPSHLRAAIRAYRQYLQEVPRGGRRDDAVEHLGDLEQQRLAMGLAPVEPEVARVENESRTQLMITSQTAGARAGIDGGELLPVPVVKSATVGEHAVRVEADGFFPQDVTAVAIEGRLVVSQVDLQPMPAQVALRAPNGAQVTVDGRPVGTAPFSRPLELPAGRHYLSASQSGRQTFNKELELSRGQLFELEAEMETTTQREVSYYFLGAGGVLLVGTAAVVTVALLSEGQARLILRKRDVDEQNLTPTELDDYIRARDRRNDLLTASTASLVGGLLVSGIGAALYLLDASEPVYQPSGISPMWSPDGPTGVSYTGRF
ncbi:MAG: PEGA domain-containing protein [Deltaproteobacteria bacterium]|nr:PEGA domain-containing protein [Deltaproteobacteria bacterium]